MYCHRFVLFRGGFLVTQCAFPDSTLQVQASEAQAKQLCIHAKLRANQCQSQGPGRGLRIRGKSVQLMHLYTHTLIWYLAYVIAELSGVIDLRIKPRGLSTTPTSSCFYASTILHRCVDYAYISSIMTSWAPTPAGLQEILQTILDSTDTQNAAVQRDITHVGSFRAPHRVRRALMKATTRN